MIFSNGLDDKVRDGSKTQTRRLVKGGAYAGLMINHEIIGVYERKNRLKWAVGNTYATRPKRGAKANGRFQLTRIRKETLQSITEADAIAEGVTKLLNTGTEWWPNEAIISFKRLWKSIHKKKGTRWEDNPLVWVLEIENVGSS